MTTSRAPFSRGAFLAGGASLVAGCTAIGRTGAGGRKNATTIPGTLRYADGEGISGMNDHLVPQLSVGFLADLHQGFLIRYDDKDRPYADLATVVPSLANGGISKDGKTIAFTLRRGLTWSDGAPFSADDVVFTMHATANPANGDLFKTSLDSIVDVDRRGADEVVFRLSRPYAAFTDLLFSSDAGCIMPKHLLGTLPDIVHATYNALPIGLGPFSVRSWARNDAVTLVANTNYHLGRPKLDRIVYSLATDWQTILTSLRTGELDLACLMPASQYVAAKEIPGYHGVAVAGGTFTQLGLNGARPPLNDVRVRRALRLATNRRLLAERVMHGLVDLQESPVGAQSPHTDTHLPFVEFDLRRAAAMLDAAGFRPGADGVRANGSLRLAFQMVIVSGSPQRDQIAAILQADWAKIGIALEVKHYTATTLFDSYANGGILQHGKYDIEQTQQGYGLYGDETTIYACKSLPPSGNDVTHYCSPAFDRAASDFDEAYDPVRSQAAADAFQKQLADDVPTITLYIARDLYAVSDDFTGFAPRGTFDGSENWSI